MKKIEKSLVWGALAIMLAALLWSLDGVFIRPKFYELPAALVVFLEHIFGFIVLSPFVILNWRKIKSLDKKSWKAILWISFFGGLLGTLMITKAFFAAIFGEVTFATVILLQKLQPVFALLLARLILKERVSKKFYIWAVVAILAGYILAFGKEGLDFGSIDWFNNAAFFAILAAFSFGSSTVFGKRLVNHIDFKTATALRFGVTSLLALVLVVVNKDIMQIGSISGIQWGLLWLIVFTSGAGAMFIYYFGLRRVTASVATICELFWPLSAVVLDYIINKNVLNTIQILAALILLFAFYKVVSEGKAKNIEFVSKVIHGQGRGKRLGFPTANLEKIDLDIPHGIYEVEISLHSESKKGLMHFGFVDTFGESVTTEILIKDFEGDIYDKELKIRTIKYIRSVKKFKNSEELKEKIKQDLKNI